MNERLAHWCARTALVLLGLLPVRVVALIGRGCGALAYLVDPRHRRMVRVNLRRCFGRTMDRHQIAALAREVFRRVGENFAAGLRTARLRERGVRRVLEFKSHPAMERRVAEHRGSIVVAIGHFGNFELYAHAGVFIPQLQFATTFRGLRQPLLNSLLRQVRETTGCLYFDRRTEFGALREAMNKHRLMVGFLADQHAGAHGLRLPFLGHHASTNAAPAIFALRYGCPLFTAICYRTSLGRWRIEVGDEIPLEANGQTRSVEAISLDINRAFEAAVRRDPANWFWVHNRWKSPGRAHRSVPLEPEAS